MINSNIKKIDRVIVIGVMGSIGSFIANKLIEENINVVGIDISERINSSLSKNINLHIDDILRPTAETIAELKSAKTVVLAVSCQVIGAALPVILKNINSDCLLVDTLSIKKPFLELINHHLVSQQVLGINPMFSGDLNPQGRPVATVIYRDGHTAKTFLELLGSWDLRVVLMEVNEHDRVMAVVQSLGHAALLAFGKALINADIDPSLVNVLAPPPFRLLLTLLARLTQNHPDVYWEIQADNPYAQIYRGSLQSCLSDLENTISLGDRNKFDADLGSLKSDLINKLPEFVQLSRDVFEFIHQKNTSDEQY